MKTLSKKQLGKNLYNIPDQPRQLYAIGDTKLLASTPIKIAIVGSRRHSSYGQEVTHAIVDGLKGYNVAIVSGLAFGIDHTAHQRAIENNIKTIAVLPSGLNDGAIYPRSHLDLAKNIVKEGGLLVSDFEPDQRATPWSFPLRNRIIAGLADVVIIIECEKDSGTMITARLANEYGRTLYAVPQNILLNSEVSEGGNELIKRGANIFTKDALADIIEDFKIKLIKTK